MKRSQKRGVGRLLIILIVVFLFATEAGTYFLTVTYQPENLPVQYFRIILTIALMICLFLGYSWARWFTGIACILGFFGAAVAAVMLLKRSDEAMLGGIYMFACIGYVFAAWALFMSESVKSYFKYMRRHR